MNCSEPIRVAQIIGKMCAGGVEAVIFNYYRSLEHDKVQFDFFYDADSTVSPPEDLINQGARFYKISPYQKIWRYMPELRRILKENNYKIVHSHLNTLSIFPLFVAWTLHVPCRIAHNHSVPGGNEWKRNIIKSILKKFSKVFATDYFACSEKAGRWLFGNKCYENREVCIIRNAIDFTKFKINKNESDSLKGKLNIEEEVVYGHIGRFTYAKNHKKLLNIFKKIHLQNSNTKLILVGDGELHKQICEHITELSLNDSVICVGKVSNPEVYYSIIDVMVMPSHFEGFAMVAIEAQASGVPIVVSNAIPCEVVISDACSFMSLEDSDDSWAKVAENLYGKSVHLNKNSKEFNIKKCASELQSWYIEHLR